MLAQPVAVVEKKSNGRAKLIAGGGGHRKRAAPAEHLGSEEACHSETLSLHFWALLRSLSLFRETRRGTQWPPNLSKVRLLLKEVATLLQFACASLDAVSHVLGCPSVIHGPCREARHTCQAPPKYKESSVHDTI
ncbi:hypothetical protein LMH87_010442 [Akanthomyces muscarius]|uniref:Uncharacterized protein n=1 Tax=Akanthomyces muscarius TaxID=2231603 RepID=A0A9W8QDB7_AKAMU|nr:hypothetical protein LMH87_010442 [Akanthomyces muscarius]KAJ4153978.1 hypothetical protein LMH87_010442 [Akanthomyces muscarius]